ncbi:MAG: Staley 55, partial [Bacillales bacterium]|nr:Staley 55 [Bacillales bacterium]
NQRAIAVSIAGKDHMEDFLVLMSNYGKALEYTATAQNSSGTAMDKFANYEESVEAKTKKLTSSLQELASDTLDSGLVKGFLDLSNALVQVTDKIGIFNIALLAISGVLGGKGIIMIKPLAEWIGKLILPMLGASEAAGVLAGTLGAALSVIAPVGAIVGAIALYKHFNVTLEETQAKLAKQKEVYDNETSKVQSLTTELETAKSKLEELNKVGGAVVTKDGEKEKLQAQTDELQRQLDIAKETQRIKGLEAEQTATETLGQKINSKYNAKEIHSDLFGYSVKYDKVTRDVELGRTIEDYNNLSVSYTDLEKKQQTLAKANKGNTKEFKDNAKELSNISKKMQDATKHSNELATKMQTESESLKGATTEGNAMKNTINNSLESYHSWINSINATNGSLSETETASEKANNGMEANANAAQEAATKLQQTNDTIDDYQTKMGEIKNALSDVSKLSTSDIMDFMQQHPTFDWGKYGVTGAAGVGDLTGAFKALGAEQYDAITQSLGARDSFKALYDETINVTDATGQYDNTLKSSIDSISKFNTSLSSMDSAYASLSQKQSVSVEDIASLSETFGDVEGFDDFIKTISSAKSMTSDVKDAFNSLVGTYLNTSGVLNNLTDDNKQLIATQLQHIGVSNAEQVVTEALARKKKILAEAGEDVTNATADEIVQLLNEHNVSEDTRIALSNLAIQKMNVNNVALSTSGDIQNLISLMEITNAATGALRALQQVKSGNHIIGISGKDLPYLEQAAQKETDDYIKGLQAKANAQFSNVKYSGGDKTSSAADKQKKGNEETKKDFSQVFDWIEIKIDKLKEKAQKAIDDVSKYIYYKSQNDQLDLAISTQIDEKKSLKSLMASYNKMADKVKLPKKYKDLVDNGGFNIQTIKNESLAKKIEEYQKLKDAAAGVADEIEKIDDKIKELNALKLTNITEYFGDRSDYISAKISRKESEVSLKTDSGKSPTKHDYKALIKLQNDFKKDNQEGLAAYTKQFNEQIKNGDITKGSPEYLKGMSHINDLTKAINESQSAAYNYKTEIRELDWKGFDNGIIKVNNMKSELSDLSDLIKDSEILDDKGNYTQAGLTKLGLLSQQMNANTKLAFEYGEAIKKIGRELKNGTITQDQYNEELANYQSLQRQAVKDNQALEDSIAEIAKQRIQFEIDAINKETDAFKDLVDAKKDALQAEKDLHDYQESINKKQKSIDTLQKQIAALKLSTDRSDIAQRLKLEKDLKDQQADLDEEQYQHSVEAQSDALDDEYDSYKKSQDEKVTALEKSLEDQEALVKSALDEVYANTAEISTGIQTLASEHGLTVSESIVSPWENAKTAIDAYKTALASLPASNELIGTIFGAEIGAGTASSSKGNSGSSSNGTSSQKSTKDSASSNTSKNKETKSSLPISTVKYTGNKSALNKNTSIVDRLKYNDLDSSSSARSKLYKYFGLSGSYTGTDSQNSKLIAAMKKAGFSQGGTGKLVNSLEDEGFTLMKRDEAMLSSAQTEQFKTLLGYAPMIKPAIDSISGNNNYPNIQNSDPINIQYDSLIKVEGNVDSSNIKQLELIAQKAV